MLSNKVTVYFPSSDHNDVEPWAHRLSQIFGGCTAIPGAKGFWIDPAGTLIADDITLLVCFTDRDPDTCFQHARLMCKQIKDLYRQQCVSLEFNGTLYFIS
jgi:hypothetical protein